VVTAKSAHVHPAAIKKKQGHSEAWAWEWSSSPNIT